MSRTTVLVLCALIIALPAVCIAEEKAAEGKTETTTTVEIGQQTKAPEKTTITEALKSRKVSFYFNETPVTKAIQFLSDLTGINFIVDVPEENEPKITLRVKKMNLNNALHWICKLAKVKYYVVKEAIYVGTKPANNKYLKVYNIKDLLHPAQDFPGPTMTMPSDGDEEPFKLDGAIDNENKKMDPQVIVDTIKEVTKEEPEPNLDK